MYICDLLKHTIKLEIKVANSFLKWTANNYKKYGWAIIE